MKIRAIYDNGGKTLDRYTVVIDDNAETFDGKWWTMLGLSEGGVGFSQFTEGVYDFANDRNNRHLGKRVRFEDLSAETQTHIAGRIF